MRLKQYSQTFRGKVVLSFMIATLITFLVVSVLFYNGIDRTLRQNQAKQMEAVSQAVSDVLAEKLDRGLQIRDGGDLESYLEFIKSTYGAYVWIVQPNGTIVMDNGIPYEARENILYLPQKEPESADILSSELIQWGQGQRPVLPSPYVSGGSTVTGISFSGGNFMGLFKNVPGVSWISVVQPVLDSQDSDVQLYIQVHMRYNLHSVNRSYMISSMVLSMSVSLLLALIIIVIFSHAITKPINELSQAASKAAMGDLSVRVNYPPVKTTYQDEPDESVLPFDDVTMLVNTFNNMIERLEMSNSDRRDFLSSISHDLRTPLTSISGFVEGMLDGTIPPEKQERYLKIVYHETQRLRNLVNDMSEAVQLDYNSISYNMRNFDLNRLILDVISGLESLLNEKDISVQTDIREGSSKPLLVVGDEEQLNRVLYNLVSNAIKFTPQGGVIAVTTRHPAGARFVEVYVEDNGPGIEPQDLPHVFERFYKGDRSRTGNSGSGLGLYIARSILQAHGQRIKAGRSAMGGACFIFTLQLA
ncbi:MAG: HAMP domain-containing sensor histidine kinase [Oscillospiraceae bacterium]|nr:HAMP domain-containing sensor histidine kinase [Oscillospiraceae bacterium]MDD4368654.1 HAMP domain-containing sensor histidine kinase [Oscillospiraceae bacterium]